MKIGVHLTYLRVAIIIIIIIIIIILSFFQVEKTLKMVAALLRATCCVTKYIKVFRFFPARVCQVNPPPSAQIVVQGHIKIENSSSSSCSILV